MTLNILELSIVLVHYKTKELTLNCIQSIIKNNTGINIEVIVIDNNSCDGIEVELKKYFPNTIYYNTGYNAGFSRANNEGFALSTKPYVLCLNTDTIQTSNAIEKSLSYLHKNNLFSTVGIQLYYQSGKPQQTGNFFYTGGLNMLMHLPVIGPSLHKVAKRISKKGTHPEKLEAEIIEVDWLCGAYILTRKDVILEVGGFDPDFFLYGEEVEWCKRLKKKGTIGLLPKLSCIHLEGESNSGTNWEKGYNSYTSSKGKQLLLSNILSIRKREGVFWLLTNMFFIKIDFFLSFFVKLENKKTYHESQRSLNRHFFKILFNKRYFYKA